MKKIMMLAFMAFLLSGCQNGEYKTYFLQNEQNQYVLVDTKGEVLSEDAYDAYIQVGKGGYVVQKSGESGFLSSEGELISTLGEYDRLTVQGEIVLATQADKVAILDCNGKMLFDESQGYYISKEFDLPLLLKDGVYTVTDTKGSVVVETDEVITSLCAHLGSTMIITYKDKIDVVTLGIESKTTSYKIADVGNVMAMDYDVEKGYLVYDKTKENILLLNNDKVIFTIHKNLNIDHQDMDKGVGTIYFDDHKNIILVYDQKMYLLDDKGKTIKELDAYYYDQDTYVVKNKEFIYGPHSFVDDGVKVEVSGVQISPSTKFVPSGVFPVYLKNKGFVYYDFKGNQVTQDAYATAHNFDENQLAIVEDHEGKEQLIDIQGNKIGEQYEGVEYVGQGYYAVFSTENIYQIMDKEGNVVITKQFMYDRSVEKFGDKVYGIFNTGSSTYVYDMETYEIIFQELGQSVFFEEGYLLIGDKYFTLYGKELYSR